MEILTIAIPTFNRKEFLTKQLNVLLPQLTENVRLEILDNHSDDSVFFEIENIVKNCKQDNIVLRRNNVNIGGDANIARCFENCNTEWLWVLSDDDFVKDNAVAKIIEIINIHHDNVFINLQSERDYSTKGLEEFCYSKPHYAAAFTISICIYNNFKLRPYLIYFYNYLSSSQGHLILVLKYLEENGDGICSFLSYTSISYAVTAQWDKLIFIERIHMLFLPFKGKSLMHLKKAFGNIMVLILIEFINTSRMANRITRRQQIQIFLKNFHYYDLNTLFDRRTFKQIIVFLSCIINVKFAVQLVKANKIFRKKPSLL